jgi:SAM-dependent methyltransferase
VITVDFERLGLRVGDLLLDVGAGNGRHTFEALKRGASVVAVDLDDTYLPVVQEMALAMREQGEARPDASIAAVRGNALHLPFPDATFDRVIAAEVLEHIPDDATAMHEIERVLKPGGVGAVTVPRAWPERICWALSKEYTATAGGHVRIYDRGELVARLERNGLRFLGHHHAHAFHSPYWWVKCAVGIDRDEAIPARAIKRFLEWQIVKRPPGLDSVERALDPILGKSLVVYVRKPAEVRESQRVA